MHLVYVSGNYLEVDNVYFNFLSHTGTEDHERQLPIVLLQNYPNPFNPSTAVTYTVPVLSDMNLTVYDVAGRLVRELEDGPREAGTHTVLWDGKDGSGRRVSSGIFLYRLASGTFSTTKKMVLLR